MKSAQASRRPDIVTLDGNGVESARTFRAGTLDTLRRCAARSLLRTSFFLPEIHTDVSRRYYVACLRSRFTDRIAVLRVSSGVVTRTRYFLVRGGLAVGDEERFAGEWFSCTNGSRADVSFYEASGCLASIGREALTDLKPESRRCRLVSETPTF